MSEQAAEKVRAGLVDGCAYACGCDRPGNPSACIHADRFAALDSLDAELVSLKDALDGAEAGYAVLRETAAARPAETEIGDTYADGYTAGLMEAIWIMNRAAREALGRQA